MRRHPLTPGAIARRATLLALLATAVACGSRGGPLPPLRPLPPALSNVRVAQRGTDAVLRFTAPSPTVNVEGMQVGLDRVEILMLTERYPAIGPEILASSLEGERRDRLQAAREAAERAERTLARQRGEEVEEPAEEPEQDGERVLSPEEELLRRVPSDVRMAWRGNNEVLAPVILESARRLDKAVDLLWTELGLPTAIIDQRRPPALPDPVAVIAAAERVSRSLSYEGDREADVFLEGAAVVATIPIANLDDYRVGDDLQVVQAVGAPAQSDIRTRYFFAVRSVSVRGQPGEIQDVAALAPVAVPLAPETVTATVVEAGVLLAWEPPAADITGELIAPESVRYNVYRKLPSAASFPDTPRNSAALELTELTDTEVDWDESYVYEIRALNAPLEEEAAATPSTAAASTEATEAAPPSASPSSGPVKESFGRQTDEVHVVDTFAPPAVLELQAVRAASTVTLRWNAVTVTDLAGYRVYRHRAPAPGIPGLPAEPAPEMAAAGAEPAATEVAAGEEAVSEEAVSEEATQQEAAQQEAEPPPAAPQTAPEAAQEPDQETPRTRRRNALVAAGWELLTAVPVTEARFIDPSADPDVEWVYVVEAVDESGNAGTPAAVTVTVPEGGRR